MRQYSRGSGGMIQGMKRQAASGMQGWWPMVATQIRTVRTATPLAPGMQAGKTYHARSFECFLNGCHVAVFCTSALLHSLDYLSPNKFPRGSRPASKLAGSGFARLLPSSPPPIIRPH